MRERATEHRAASVDGASLAQLTLVRFREFIREPEAVFWTFFFPVVLAIGLGIAFRNKPAEVLVVGVVRGSAAADTLAARLTRAGGCAYSARRRPPRRARCAPAKWRSWRRRTAPARGIRFDDTRPEGRTARFSSTTPCSARRAGAIPCRAAERKVREKGSRYIDFVIPGLLGMNIMGGGIWGLGFAIVERAGRTCSSGSSRRRCRRTHYLASFLSRASVPARRGGGDPRQRGAAVRRAGARLALQLAVVCVVVGAAFGGLGLLIASRAKTTEGVSGLMNLVMMPMWVLSGVFFSSTNFPAAAQPFIQALPLTATINALRGDDAAGGGLERRCPCRS